VGLWDLIIAATAQKLGLELATDNVKHLLMFSALRPPHFA
jgi:predicted nucleic acid-binding protein